MAAGNTKKAVRAKIKAPTTTELAQGVKWNPWVGVLLVLAIYVLSQVVGLVVLIYPALRHFSAAQSSNWLDNDIFAQFFYILVVEAFTVLAVLQLLKWFKVDKKVIGLRKPKAKDAFYTLASVPVYYILYIVAVIVISSFVKINVSETQNVGFNSVHGASELIVTFISLVILPPIAEEILVRGFLYSSLKKGSDQVFRYFHYPATKKFLPLIVAALVTSAIFASAHLPEGTSGPLWIGFIETFILSLVLIGLREKTNGLWSGMGLHAVNNGVAYYVLYLAPLINLHI